MHDPTDPIIERALRGLRAWGEDLKPADAKRLLDTWKHVEELSDREYAAVLGWCGWTRRACRDCGGLVLFVSDGPDPGWWSHDLVPDPAHPAVPEVRRDDPDATQRLGRIPFGGPSVGGGE